MRARRAVCGRRRVIPECFELIEDARSRYGRRTFIDALASAIRALPIATITQIAFRAHLYYRNWRYFEHGNPTEGERIAESHSVSASLRRVFRATVCLNRDESNEQLMMSIEELTSLRYETLKSTA